MFKGLTPIRGMWRGVSGFSQAKKDEPVEKVVPSVANKIYVVDDEGFQLRMVQNQLQAMGVKPENIIAQTGFSNVNDIFTEFNEHKAEIALVIMDRNLGIGQNMKGDDLLPMLRIRCEEDSISAPKMFLHSTDCLEPDDDLVISSQNDGFDLLPKGQLFSIKDVIDDLVVRQQPPEPEGHNI